MFAESQAAALQGAMLQTAAAACVLMVSNSASCLAEWKAMTAVRNSRVFVADGLTYFNRSSPRVVHSAEIVAEALHPELAGGHLVSINCTSCMHGLALPHAQVVRVESYVSQRSLVMQVCGGTWAPRC